MIKALIFDLDGVLANTEWLHKKTLAAAAKEFGYVVPDTDTRTTLEKLYAAGIAPDVAQLIYTRKKELYNAVISTAVPNFSLVAQLARIGKEARYLQAVCSNSNVATSTLLLHRIGVLPYLDVRVYSDSQGVTKGKPSHDPYTVTCQRLGVAPDEAVAFEDSETGIASATAAGIKRVVKVTTETLIEELKKW